VAFWVSSVVASVVAISAVAGDIQLKHDIVLLGHFDNGLGFYRFRYNGSDKAYVGVMAQEVQDRARLGGGGVVPAAFDLAGVPSPARSV
jgi:hypothetical protein